MTAVPSNFDLLAENWNFRLEDAKRVQAFAPRRSRSHVFLRAVAFSPFRNGLAREIVTRYASTATSRILSVIGRQESTNRFYLAQYQRNVVEKTTSVSSITKIKLLKGFFKLW